MPLYDYRCDQCADVIEVAVRWPAPDYLDDPCRLCGGSMHKQLSAPAFRIDGYNAKNGYSKKEK